MTASLNPPNAADSWPPVDAATRCCAVYGFPVRHSASPSMQNAAFAALGLNWRYLAFEVAPDDLPTALAGAKAMRFAGVNLTVPHKLLALNLMDVLDESARRWGAVNTVRFEGRDPDGLWRPVAAMDGAPPENPCPRFQHRRGCHHPRGP